MILFTLVTQDLLVLSDYVQTSPDMTIFSQISFWQWLVVPVEETMLCSALADGSDPFSPTTPCLLLLSTEVLCLSKEHAQSPDCTAQYIFHSKNGRTRCIKSAPWQHCALSMQVFSLECLCFGQQPPRPLSPKHAHMQEAHQVCKEFVKSQFCTIGLINWEGYSSVANFNINYSSFHFHSSLLLFPFNLFLPSSSIFSLALRSAMWSAPCFAILCYYSFANLTPWKSLHCEQKGSVIAQLCIRQGENLHLLVS